MAEQFNEKEGLLKAIKTALKSDNFIMAVFNMLFGDENGAKEVEFELKKAGQENTLNEMVAVHRFFKSNLNESKLGKVKDIFKARKLMKKIGSLKGKSVDFYREVLIRTLKKPGQLAALMYMIKAVVTLGYPIDDVIAMPVAIKFFMGLLETAAEVSSEEKAPAESGEINERYDPNAQEVSLFVGRFQPFTLGHVKCLQKLKEKFGAPVFVCAIPVTEDNADEKHPFYGQLQDEMYERLRTGLNAEFPDLIATVDYVPRAYIGDLVDLAKSKGFQPIGWGCGTDRYEVITPRKRKKKEGESDFVVSGYKPQTDKYVEQQRGLDAETQNINPDNFDILHIQRDVLGNGDDPVSKISGSKVREAIKNDDVETFESMMPQCLYPLFGAFQKALKRFDEPVEQEPEYQTSGALAEDKEYFEYRKRLDEAIERLVKGKK